MALGTDVKKKVGEEAGGTDRPSLDFDPQIPGSITQYSRPSVSHHRLAQLRASVSPSAVEPSSMRDSRNPT